MNPPQVILALSNIIVGIVLIATSMPLITRRIGPNRWYGFRIAKAFQSNELWYDINAYGGRQLRAWALAIIIAGLACLFIPLSRTPPVRTVLLLGCGPVVLFTMIPLVKTLLYARKR